MFVDRVYKKAMWNKSMDLLMEVERQHGMEKVKQVATFLWSMGFLDARTLDLMKNDVVTSEIREEKK